MTPDGPRTAGEAFEWARNVREARAALLERVGRGELDVVGAAALAAGSPECRDLWVVSVGEVTPGVGKVGCRKALRRLGIDEKAGLGRLAARDVNALAEALA
jgi:hypothetical protein